MPAVADRPVASPEREAFKGKLFRCFAYKHKSGFFVAECIDLNLIVKAKTMKKAISSLGDAIEGYLAVVATGEDQAQLLSRHSPLSHLIHYHAVGVKLHLAKALKSFERLKFGQLYS